MGELTMRAKEAQDAIGWAPGGARCPLCSEVLDLARVVVQLAGAVEQLQSRPLIVNQPPQAPSDDVECCASGSCEVCRR